VDIPGRQGVRRTETFTSTGLPFQRIRLTGDVIAQGTITVTVGTTPGARSIIFQDSLADSRHFMADLDALDISTLIFGDGQSGAVPLREAPSPSAICRPSETRAISARTGSPNC
jgi:hypothetical protein